MYGSVQLNHPLFIFMVAIIILWYLLVKHAFTIIYYHLHSFTIMYIHLLKHLLNITMHKMLLLFGWGSPNSALLCGAKTQAARAFPAVAMPGRLRQAAGSIRIRHFLPTRGTHKPCLKPNSWTSHCRWTAANVHRCHRRSWSGASMLGKRHGQPPDHCVNHVPLQCSLAYHHAGAETMWSGSQKSCKFDQASGGCVEWPAHSLGPIENQGGVAKPKHRYQHH